jgi:hypothetical protein
MSYFSNFSQYAPTLPNLSQYAPTLPNFSSVTSGFSENWSALKGRISVAGQEARGYCSRNSSSVIENIRGVWEKFLSYFSVSDATSSLSANWSSLRGRVSVAYQSAQEYCVSIGASLSEKVQAIRENLVSYLPVSGAYARGLQTQLSQSEERLVTLAAALSTSEGHLTARGTDNAELLSKLREARSQVEEFKRLGPAVRGKIGEYEFRIDTLERENAQLSADLGEARAGLDHVRRANADLEKQLRERPDLVVRLPALDESAGLPGDELVVKTGQRTSSLPRSVAKGVANWLGARTPRGGSQSRRPSFSNEGYAPESSSRGSSHDPDADRGSFSASRPGSAPLPASAYLVERSKSPSIGRGQVAPE